MADVFEDRLDSSYDEPRRSSYGDKVDVPDDRKFVGFDGYKKAMDCLQAGRRRHPRHAAGLPLGALRLRHREGPQRLHGEAGHRRRPDAPGKMLALGEEADEEEPQGRRRPDVPALRRPPGAVRPHQGRRRSATSSCCGPTAWPARSARRFAGPKPDGISELLYQIQQLPRLPLGQRRLLTATSSSTTSTSAAG